MEDRAYQGPYPESIEKAKTLVLREPCVIRRIGGSMVDPDGRYVVPMDYPDPLRIAPSSIIGQALLARIARWIDALPTNVKYVESVYEDKCYIVRAVKLCNELWEAQIEAITHGASEPAQGEQSCTTG